MYIFYLFIYLVPLFTCHKILVYVWWVASLSSLVLHVWFWLVCRFCTVCCRMSSWGGGTVFIYRIGTAIECELQLYNAFILIWDALQNVQLIN